MKNNKQKIFRRGQAYGFWIATLGFAIALLLILFPTFIIDPSKNNEYAGATSTSLFQAQYDAQERMAFIDEAGQYALYDTLRSLAQNGGFIKPNDEKGCGQHSYNLWSNTQHTCYPDENKNLETQYPLQFGSYLQQTTYPYPQDNYDYTYAYDKGVDTPAKAKNNIITQAFLNNQDYANLLVKPHYRAHYDSTLTVYEKIKQWASETLAGCYDDPPLCLKKAMDVHNQQEDLTQSDSFTLSTQCPLFDNLAENYEDCLWTKQKDCTCTLPIDPSLALDMKNGKLILLQPYYQEYETRLPTALDEQTANQYHYEKQTLTIYQDSNEVKKIENYPSLTLYKEAGGGLTFLSDATGKIPCTINKARIALCVTTKHELPYVQPGKVEWKNVVIQFALELLDRIPPFPSVDARDKPSTIPQLTPPTGSEPSEGILVSWDKPNYEDGKSVEDIDHYLIYCSKGSFSDKQVERTPTYALPFDDRKQVSYYNGEKTNWIPALNKIAGESHYTITLQLCGNEEIHNDPKISEKLYQVYVTAVDKNGNEIKEIPKPVEACPSSYYIEHPPTFDPTGTLMIEYDTYLWSVRQECWPKT